MKSILNDYDQYFMYSKYYYINSNALVKTKNKVTLQQNTLKLDAIYGFMVFQIINFIRIKFWLIEAEKLMKRVANNN